NTRRFYLGYALADQLFFNRFAVKLLDRFGRGFGRHGGDLLVNLVDILIARVDPVEVEDGEAAQFPHGDGELRIDDSVHGARHQRNLELTVADLRGDFHFFGIDG